MNYQILHAFHKEWDNFIEELSNPSKVAWDFFSMLSLRCKFEWFTLFGPHCGGSPKTSFHVCDNGPSVCCEEFWFAMLEKLLPRVICPCFLLVATGIPVGDFPFPAISSMSKDWLVGGLWFSWLEMSSCS